jgi:hypothetical protein
MANIPTQLSASSSNGQLFSFTYDTPSLTTPSVLKAAEPLTASKLSLFSFVPVATGTLRFWSVGATNTVLASRPIVAGQSLDIAVPREAASWIAPKGSAFGISSDVALTNPNSTITAGFFNEVI